MKAILAACAAVLFFSSGLRAGDPEIIEAKFKVYGNCSMCKKRIESALKIAEVKFARWDKKTKALTVAYLSPGISLDSLQHRVAAVGHDTEKYTAADSTYESLPACCLYRDRDQTH